MFSSLEESKKAYTDSSELSLPYETKFGWTLGEIKGFCPKCHQELDGLKGKINEYASCVEVRMIGLCHKCKAVIQCNPVRQYSDGHAMIHDDETGWTEVTPHGSHSGILKTALYGLAVGILIALVIILIVA